MADGLKLSEGAALLAGYTTDPAVSVSLYVKGLTNHSVLPDRTVLRPTESGLAMIETLRSLDPWKRQ